MRRAILIAAIVALVTPAYSQPSWGGRSASLSAVTLTMTTNVTCVAGAGASTLSLNPTCPTQGGTVVVPVINSDVDGCTITMSESSALLGCTAIISLVSTSGGTITLADVTNIAELDGSWTPVASDNLILVYEDLANDRWQEAGRNESWNDANDGAGSTLDADLLDGSSSAAFAVVAGGNVFAASNTYAADDITDADVSNTLTCSLFVGSGSTTTAIDLATAEVAGDLPIANATALFDIAATRVITGNPVFEGLTADLNETTLAFTDPTADRTITFKDETGTVCTSVGDCAFAASNTYAADDITDADVSNTLTSSLFVGSGSTTTAIDLATAEVSGDLPIANATALFDIAATRVITGNPVFEGITADLNETTLAFTDPTADRTITFGDQTGTVCLSAGGCAFAASNTYVADDITDADVSNTLTCSLFVGSGSTTTAIDLATAEAAGTLPIANGGTGVTTTALTVAGALKSATTNVSVEAATAPTNGQVLTATGGTTATWQAAGAATGTLLRNPIYTTSGTTYTTGTGTTLLLVRMCGGGGGGGGSNATGQEGGGGSGGYAEKAFTTTASTAYTIAVGAGGAGGASGGAVGGTGGNTTFAVGATTVTAFGGVGGPRDNGPGVGIHQLGGAGGAVSTNGDLNIAGFSARTHIDGELSGAGASSMYGNGGASLVATGAGNAATGFCAGGGGAWITNAGGAGTGGLIITYEMVAP